MLLSTPRRRCVGSTATKVTPAAGSTSCPGTLSWKLKHIVTPTGVVSSKAARVRSNSNRSRTIRRWLSDIGEPWKACSSTIMKLSNSSSSMGRIGYGPPARLLADSVMYALVPLSAPSARLV